MSEESYVLSAATYEALQDLLGDARDRPAMRRPGQQRRAPQPASGMVWVKVTSASTSSVTLAGGSHVNCYPAKWSYYDSYAGAWTDNDNVWFLPANGETPGLNTRYLCKCVGADSSNEAIYTIEIQGASSGGGGSIEVKQASGSPDYTAVPTLIVDQATGLAIESGSSSNPATLELLAASATQQGAVTTTAQTFAGDKTFNNRVIMVTGGSGGPASGFYVTDGLMGLKVSGFSTGGYVRFDHFTGSIGSETVDVTLFLGGTDLSTTETTSYGLTFQGQVQANGGFATRLSGTRYVGVSGQMGPVFKNGIATSIPTAPIITGSRGGNAALASLLTGLASLGVIVDGTGP